MFRTSGSRDEKGQKAYTSANSKEVVDLCAVRMDAP